MNTTSDGGTNIYGEVDHSTMVNKIALLKASSNYEIQRDKIYRNAAINYIINNPLNTFNNMIDKLIAFWIHDFDSKYPGIHNLLYWLPWLTLIPFFLFGLIKSFTEFKKFWFFYSYFLIHTLLMVSFFVLPRYRLFIFPFMSMFSCYGFIEIIDNKSPKV